MTVARLFVYGTLQDDSLVERLTGRRLPSRPAMLPGYRRIVDPSIGYPVVREAAGARVDGKLLDGLADRDLKALDAYEGHQYHRIVVRVRASGGQAIHAYTYIPAKSSPRTKSFPTSRRVGAPRR